MKRSVLISAAVVMLFATASFSVADAIEESELTVFQAGTPAVAADMNDNFDAVQAAVNDNAADITAIQADYITAVTAGSGLSGGGTAGSVTIAIGSGAVTGSHIATDTITASDIAAGAVTTSEILDGTVTGTDIANYTITYQDIASNTITATNIGANAVGTSEITDGSITTTDISTSSFDARYLRGDTSDTMSGTLTATAVSTGAVNYSTARTHEMVIPGFAWIPWSTSDPFTHEYSSAGAYCTSGTSRIVAPVYLPDGAVITAVRFNLYDNSASNDLSIYLSGVSYSSGWSGGVASFISAGSAGWQNTEVTGLSYLVDGASKGLILQALPASGSVWDGAIRVYAVRITYTLDQAP